MDNVLPFKLPYDPPREQALHWLQLQFRKRKFFWPIPDEMPNKIGDDLFHGWRFVNILLTGEVVFGNGLSPGIRFEEVFA